MASRLRLVIVSDLHYAGPAERARRGFERRAIANPLLSLTAQAYRHFLWLRDPLDHWPMLDQFLARATALRPDWVVANGDYSCDSAFTGMSDDAAFASAQECLGKLRGAFGEKFAATMGDHELGKFSLFGQIGGLRLASWSRCLETLQLRPCWKLDLGRYALIGVTSTVVAMDIYEHEAPAEDRAAWRAIHAAHLAEIRAAFDSVLPDQRIILFCHDPTALPFLAREASVSARFPQLEQTIIGHLHTPLVLKQTRWLAGMPRIRFLGRTAQRMSTALNEARHWKPFRVRLCPALTGIQLLKDGGFWEAELDVDAAVPACFTFHPLPWT